MSEIPGNIGGIAKIMAPIVYDFAQEKLSDLISNIFDLF